MDQIWVEAISGGMHGAWSHPDTLDVLEDVDHIMAGRMVDGLPFSIWQLTRHMVEWGWIMLNSMKGQDTKSPQPDDNNFFPVESAPPDAESWNSHKMAFDELSKEAAKVAREIDPTIRFPQYDNISVADSMMVLISHNSYHTGQIVMIKRLLDR